MIVIGSNRPKVDILKYLLFPEILVEFQNTNMNSKRGLHEVNKIKDREL